MEKNDIEINEIVGDDNGNSDHKIIINGELINQPNVISKVRRLPNFDELNTKFIAENIKDNLIVAIVSPSVTTGNYYIGTNTKKATSKTRSIEIGVDNNKIESEIIMISTLAQIAGYAVKQAYKEDPKFERNIKVKVDMATALPMTYYNKSNGEIFAKKFTCDKHQVTVFVGSCKAKVEIEFVYVKVIPEGVTAIHCLQNATDEIFNAFNEKYNLEADKSYFKDKRILHIAIGEGTTEYPLTEDISFVLNPEGGSNNGVGHAIKRSLEEFKEKFGLESYTRQEFSNVLINEDHRYNEVATDIVADYMDEQADEILGIAKDKLKSISNEVDIVAVYGGGSIPMREYLEEKLEKLCSRADIKLFYVPEEFAVTLEAKGLYAFATGPIFEALKEKALNSK